MTRDVITAIAVVVLMLAIGGAMTTVGEWYRNLNKPGWNPPDWVFGPAWTIILGLAAWAGVIAWRGADDDVERLQIILLFGLNITFHMLWSPLFFNLRRPDWALMEVPFLWLSILALIVALSPISPLCGVLLTPYLLWVSFAAVLNFVIVKMNPRI